MRRTLPINLCGSVRGSGQREWQSQKVAEPPKPAGTDHVIFYDRTKAPPGRMTKEFLPWSFLLSGRHHILQSCLVPALTFSLLIATTGCRGCQNSSKSTQPTLSRTSSSCNASTKNSCSSQSASEGCLLSCIDTLKTHAPYHMNVLLF